jgi:DNA-binding response OmpR family regulator
LVVYSQVYPDKLLLTSSLHFYSPFRAFHACQLKLAPIMLENEHKIAMSMNLSTSQDTISMPNSGGSGSTVPSSEPRPKILIVDDNPVILKTLGMKLESSGFEVLAADEGAKAVSTVRREKPDLILLDICFPPDVGHGGGVAWDGFLILNWLRRMDEAVNTPIIIITGEDPAKHKQRCLSAGVAGFFSKPVDPDQLLQTIYQTLGLAPVDEPAVPPPPAPPKVLFIDDETDWRFMVTTYLQDAGYEVLTARDASEALAHMEIVNPDLIILDLNLAGVSGTPLLRTLKESHPQTPVLVYTGIAHDQTAIDELLAQGAAQYLPKGTMGEMLRKVQNALGVLPPQ